MSEERSLPPEVPSGQPDTKELVVAMIDGARVIRDAQSDTCLVVIGGVHGNEPAGMRAIVRLATLVESGDWKPTCAIFGLVGHPQAVAANARFITENLNRAFGHATVGTVEHARAEEISLWLRALKAAYRKLYVLDLHSVSVGDTRIAIVNDTPGRRALVDAVSSIPLKLLAPNGVVPGTLLGFVEEIGGAAIAIECGNHESPLGETVAMEHAERMLEHLGVLSTKRTSFIGVSYEGKSRTYALIEAIKPAVGFTWTIPISSELFVPEGTVFATDSTREHVAPTDCYLMMPSKEPLSTDYDAGFLAARV